MRAFLAMEGTDLLQMRAFGEHDRTVAIGAIIGGWRLRSSEDVGDLRQHLRGHRSFSGEESRNSSKAKGWCEWPMKHIPIFMVIAFFGVTAVFLLDGFQCRVGGVFDHVLLSTTFLLGAIAVRVMGETSIEPVRTCSSCSSSSSPCSLELRTSQV